MDQAPLCRLVDAPEAFSAFVAGAANVWLRGGNFQGTVSAGGGDTFTPRQFRHTHTHTHTNQRQTLAVGAWQCKGGHMSTCGRSRGNNRGCFSPTPRGGQRSVWIQCHRHGNHVWVEDGRQTCHIPETPPHTHTHTQVSRLNFVLKKNQSEMLHFLTTPPTIPNNIPEMTLELTSWLSAIYEMDRAGG